MALLSGCQKDAATSPKSGSGVLTVNITLDRMPIAETRAAGSDTDLKTYGFYLAGYHTEGSMADASADAYPNVFDHDASDNQAAVPQVTYVNNKFTLKTIKWALDETTNLSFFGWSQNKVIPTSGITSATTGIIAQTEDIDDKGYPWIEIRNADAPADQTDIVGSRSENHSNDAVISAVDLDFKHLLSKLTFKAKSSAGANIVFTGVNLKYAANKVYKRARYTFGSEVTAMGAYSAYSERHAGTVALNTSYPSITGGAEVSLGSTLLIPQALTEGDVLLEVKYKLSPNSGNVAGAEQTKTLPLSAFTFVQGKNYVYTIDLLAVGIQISSEPTVEAWNVASTSLPLVAGPKGNTLLLLDGYDKPYLHTDGSYYWLDKSGYNRHVKLGSGYTSYNAAKHGYVFSGTATGGIIPSLGTVSTFGIDLVAEHTGTTYGSGSVAVDLNSGSNRYYFQIPYSGTSVDWNYPSSYTRWGAPSQASVDNLCFWTVTANSSLAQIYQNALWKSEKSYTPTSRELAKNYIATTYAGRISYLKISNSERALKEIVDTYNECKTRFNITEAASSYLPPVTDGLLYCYDGRSGVETINGVDYWRDQVGKADMKIAANGWTYNSDLKCFTNTSGANPMSAVYNGVTLPNNFTIELVIKASGPSAGSPVYWGDNSTPNLTNRIIFIHIPYSGGYQIFIDSPGTNRYSLSWSSDYGSSSDSRKVVIRRTYQSKSEFFMANKIVATGTATDDLTKRPCTAMEIGNMWTGNIYAFRIYGRALTDAEITQNYNSDKTIFGFTY